MPTAAVHVAVHKGSAVMAVATATPDDASHQRLLTTSLNCKFHHSCTLFERGGDTVLSDAFRSS
jgi:hypothetical protein